MQILGDLVNTRQGDECRGLSRREGAPALGSPQMLSWGFSVCTTEIQRGVRPAPSCRPQLTFCQRLSSLPAGKQIRAY